MTLSTLQDMMSLIQVRDVKKLECEVRILFTVEDKRLKKEKTGVDSKLTKLVYFLA